MPVEGQVREGEAPLAPRKVRLYTPPVDPGDELPAELNSRSVVRQGFSKVTATSTPSEPGHSLAVNSKEARMSLLINCECGRVVKAETEDEIVAKVEQHVSEDHPELVGKLSRDDIVAMSEEVDD